MTTGTTASETVGRNIRAELARRVMPQRTLAAHLGITQAQLSKRLNGHISIDVDELTAVAAFLDLPISTLLPTEEAIARAG